MTSNTFQPATFKPSGPLAGTISVPGDKSISHRALILSALAVGKSRISGLLEGEDVLATADALRAMGARIDKTDDVWTVHGVGVGGLMQPGNALDMGNSGTSTRLLMGLIASHEISATFIGDASLTKRPMGRVIEPLSQMGADISARETADHKSCLPLTVRGICPAMPIEYRLPVASAQVKSAILLAGLNTPGITRIIEPVLTRDHSETMLKGFGADITVETDAAGSRIISLTGEAELQPQKIKVPGDPSSAAFLVVAALIVPGSGIIIENVGINPTRAGLFDILQQMGGDIQFQKKRTVGGEPVADIHVRHSQLTGINVPATIAPSMIDEFPILFVAAALAGGTTTTRGLHELRVKESDRLAQMAKGLELLGVKLTANDDGLVIEGSGGKLLTGGRGKPVIETALDHRIAMSFAIAGLMTKSGLSIDDIRPVETSFPGFADLVKRLAA
ncbi:MAG: 3-phosphoshikimate 1-carboxyvinyltransferase [Sphingomonadales bacterium]|nr:3-phosphoshikimate 1-carboxyvinyltransferase [Sphingomonadales bacterium]PIX66415.1 MAG: 3-phosphoshikimate 1-carboxyvinyltransferase [Sphingomonadales bacterium CG_4_10_14_3_um_filter_58_15]NCO49563.1 3-phosphoshikimate 1-carboxyvinyltransferase [Sphingomonadales bacterium]NCO98808.1 3-phosphoshikimate 1-carboxyvinyltransferase [Sphingomonadales bacterium]NCP25791.1 3-phosphoshikimate 1-carboxyvinyltransferase [Sphingomonadales bacterium]